MIYFLEDDESIRKLVIYALMSQGFEVKGFDRPSAFRKAMKEELPELILLDIMLPEEDGISILKQLRKAPETASVPIIMVTAKGKEYERVEGLDLGADDYIVKPFGILELTARVRAVLRRNQTVPVPKEYRIGRLLISPERHVVQLDGEPVQLTVKEFSLLCLLAENAGNVMKRSVLLDSVWGLGNEPESRTLDVHIRTLRMKLKEAGSYIETVRGIGYRINGVEE